MDDVPVFKCRVCHAVISNPVWSLDRNSQQYSTGEVDGQDLTIITMLVSQEMFRYDSLDCWHVHEPTIVKELKLKTTYPDSAPITPCSRCGTSVDRYQPHISYTTMAMNLREMPDGWDAEVLDSQEFAVLCRECERSDAPDAVTEASIPEENQQERARV
jgi:hypothetical protein